MRWTSRGLLFVGTVVGLTLPFADHLQMAGPITFLNELENNNEAWSATGRFAFLLIFAGASVFQGTRESAGWAISALLLYALASGGYFIAVFTSKEPLFSEQLWGYDAFFLLLPLGGAYHLITLVWTDTPWPLAGWWARVYLSSLIILSGFLHARESKWQVGGWLAMSAGAVLVVGEIFARRDEAIEEVGVAE